VVVVNWNGLTDTMACLVSLEAATPRPARVVVVDNGSSDGSVEALRRWQAERPKAPALTLIASPTNRGFSGANNLGLARLAADPAIDHFLLLNNDATVEPAFFAELARALAMAPDAGIMGPTIYVTGGADAGQVWYAGGAFVPLRALVVHRLAVPPGAAPVATEFVTGCAMLISRRAWASPLAACRARSPRSREAASFFEGHSPPARGCACARPRPTTPRSSGASGGSSPASTATR